MARNTWLKPEKGNRAAVQLLIWISQHAGYRITSLLCWPTTLYYVAFYPTVRRASWVYLTHLYRSGKLPSRHWGMVLLHIHAYCTNILDRIYLLGGRFPPKKIHISGQHYLLDALKKGKGCILMGAHIGSFDALRQFGLDSSSRFRMVMYRRFLGAASRFIETLAPDFNADIIELGQPDSMIAVLNALKNGEIVGMLADRAHTNNRSLSIPFLGQNAPLPSGPFQLAMLAGAPIILASAIKQKNGTYHIACHPLTDELSDNASRSLKAEHLTDLMKRYANWMETLCQENPYAWFNFFDFWEEGL